MKKITYVMMGVFLILFTVSIIKSNQIKSEEIVRTNAGVTLDNKKVEWGIKRSDNHEQPDLGSKNKKLIDENEDIAMGNSEYKYVYLTFDEGYEAGYTSSILDTLKNNDVKAAFFITGHYLNTQSELVERMIKEGHIVGNHTVNHQSMPSLSEEKLKEEVMKLHSAVYEKFNYEMRYLRPPKGEFSQSSLWQTKQLGYTTVMWSFAYDDWDENKQDREEYGKEKILKNIHNGAVILLHANSKDNCNILDGVIKEIKNMGYEFKSLDEFKR